MSPYRRTRIVATVGPASRAPEKLEELIAAGVNVFRLNMSHGTQEQHREVIGRIREISGRLGRHIAILGDLCGPKIRVGTFTGGEDIYVGTLSNKGVGISPEHDAKWGAGIADEVAALEADIISGKIDVKSGY
jgi:pyruvate kinase